MNLNQLRGHLAARWPADSSDGVATTAMLASAGLTDRALTAGTNAGLVRRLQRGAYIQATHWDAAKPWQRDDLLIGDHALRLGAQLNELESMLAASPVIRGSARARTVLAALDSRSESAGESRTRVLLAGMNLPMPELQLEVQTPDGRHRADFAWRRYMLILEFDGWGKYFDYGPTDIALAQERKREKALMELGWKLIRIHWEDLAHPAELEARIRTALMNSGASLSGRRHARYA